MFNLVSFWCKQVKRLKNECVRHIVSHFRISIFE